MTDDFKCPHCNAVNDTTDWFDHWRYGAWLTKAFELQKKEKRIEKATAKWVSIASILTTVDTDIPDVIFKQLDQLHDALCGMDEIRGENNG